MPRILNGTALHEAVARDGLPRVADADDGSRHILYLDGNTVRSLTAADWLTTRGPLPRDPTPEETAAAIQAREAARQQALTDAASLRQQILTIAQSAVGGRADQLSNLQLRALFGIMLWQAGALKPDLTVRPLAEWVGGEHAPPAP